MEKLFFELLRIAIGNGDAMTRLPNSDEWDELYAMAKKQGVVELMFDGVQEVQKIQVSQRSSEEDKQVSIQRINPLLLSKWYGVKEKCKIKYHKHREFIGRLAHFYEQRGIGMMLLKGYGLSLNYPDAEARKPGDVDIFLYDLGGASSKGDATLPVWKRADEAISKSFGVDIKTECEHHTKYTLDGISVENHYDFVNTRIRKSSQSIEKLFKELAEDTSNQIVIETTSGNQQVCLPSDNLNSIFLLRHTAGHFAAEGVSIRNVLDWGFFVQHAKQLDWEWLWDVARQYNMHLFLGCLNAICMEECGFDNSLFVQKEYDSSLKTKVLNEIMNGVNLPEHASVWQRTRLWWQHRWKHKICYSDSMLSSFVYSIRANVGGSSAENGN